MRRTALKFGVIAAALVLLLAASREAIAAPKEPPPPRAVQAGRGDKLTYATDPRGDRVPDFSYCGYLGGDASIPSVPVRVVVSAKPGDQTARIQSAIDHV